MKVPTTVAGNLSSLIDLVITSVPSEVSTHGASNLGISHHHLIEAILNLKRISRKQKTKLIYDFKRVDIYALKSEFDSARWDICDIFDNMSDTAWVRETLNKYTIYETTLILRAF